MKRSWLTSLALLLAAISLLAPSGRADINQGLVAHWDFNEGSGNTLTDVSGNGHNGTTYGNPAWMTGVGGTGTALHFDGVDDHVVIANPSSFGFSNQSFSFAAWVQIEDNLNYYRDFVVIADAVDGYPRSHLLKCRSGYEQGRIVMEISQTGDPPNCAALSNDNGDQLPKNQWLFLTGVVDYAGGHIMLYVNGVLQNVVDDLVSFNLSQASQLSVWLGANPWTGWGGNHERLKGLLDEVRIYDRALSSAEILQLYSGGSNQPPVAYIGQITPKPALVGSSVNFNGHGSDNDGNVVGYCWRSSIDGQLSSEASFSTSSLSPGQHTIYFKVMDDDNEWSQEVSDSLRVISGQMAVDDKQQVINYFNGEGFYTSAEQMAQAFVNQVQSDINGGTVTSKEIEALLRLVLTEEAAASAYLSSSDIGALPIANLTGKCEGSAASALLLEILFAMFRDAVKILKGVPILGAIYDAAEGALKWVNQQILSLNRSLVCNVANRLTPGLMHRYPWTKEQAQSIAMKFGWGLVKEMEKKTVEVPLENASESVLEQLLSGVNLELYETGIPICPSCSPPLFVGGTEQTVIASVNEAQNQSFAEGNLGEIATEVREVKIPEIVNSNSDCVSAINATVSTADWMAQTQFWLTVVVFILSILAVIGGLIGCPATGIGCILAAIGGLISWSAYTTIQSFLTGLRVVAFMMGAGFGSFQLFVTLPNHLVDVRETAFQGEAQKLFVGNFDQTGQQLRLFSIPDDWADSLAQASDSVVEQLGQVRSFLAAGDWDRADSALKRLDGLMDDLMLKESVSSSYLDYAYAWNESDSMVNTDSIYYNTKGRNVEADLSLALTRFAAGSALIKQPAGAERDSVLMIIDNCLATIQSLGPAYEQAYWSLNMQGFVVPPVVSVVDHRVTDSDSGVLVEVRTKNISEVTVHGVHGRLTILDTASVSVSPVSDTVYDAFDPYEERLFKWQVQKGAEDTLIRLEFEVEPDSILGDFLGDYRLITIHSSQASIQYLCGDVDWSGSVDISDAVYLIQYIFSGGPAPQPVAAGDANCDQAVDISDAVYLIAYIFSGGPAPCEECE